MAARFVDDNERLELLRGHINVALEIVEAFKAAFEDGITLNSDAAVAMLDEASDRLRCAYTDTYASVDSEKDSEQI